MMVFIRVSFSLVLTLPLILGDVASYWNTIAQTELKRALELKPNLNQAKNVILFLGDGMGVSTVSAARLYKSQMQGKEDGVSTLSFESFPYTGLSKTYSADKQTPDSAATATAFLCGVKTNSGTLGITSDARRGNCSSQIGRDVQSILDWSQAEGKSTGIVTTSRITHATPAASYVHIADRNWESDEDMKNVEGDCTDIAKQLVKDNSNINVVLGGGRGKFFSPPIGERLDGQNLSQQWVAGSYRAGNKKGIYVSTRTELMALDVNTADHVLGLFSKSHMDYELDRVESNNANDQPSIAEMTRFAIDILRRNPKGFFLLVEGARIDHAHHETRAKKSLHDTVAMDDAVSAAQQVLDEKDTLIVVTADHSHVFSIAGYPNRGNPILGLVNNGKDRGLDDLPYTTLVYGNGLAANISQDILQNGFMRSNLTDVDTTASSFRFPTAVPLSSETHAAEDVSIFAKGPMSHLFHAVHEQNFIAHAMAYASCVGANKDHCQNPPSPTVCDNGAFNFNSVNYTSLLALSILAFILPF